MAGFVTSYLPDFPGDWICVEDFCGSWNGFGISDLLNVTAWWSPSRRQVQFGGHWFGTPHMPAQTEPTADQCWEWVKGSGTVFARKLAFHRREAAKSAERFKAIEDHFLAHGYNWISVVFSLPGGTQESVSHCCGTYGKMSMLRAATSTMLKRHPAGTRLTKFLFESGLTEDEVERRRTGRARRRKQVERKVNVALAA